MHMSAESLLVILFDRRCCRLAGRPNRARDRLWFGWRHYQFEIVGAFIASWLFPQLGIHLGAGIVAADHRCHHRRRAAARDREADPARRALVAAL